ncbi:MAG: glutamate racemase [Bacteriovoracaceae bacterium]
MAKIGVFDSGVGGFSILSEVKKKLPDHEYYYFSDDAFGPYGSKNEEQIIQRMETIVSEFCDHSIDLVIVACNTATLAGIDSLRSSFPKTAFVGVEPYVNAIHKESKRRPLTKPALLLTQASFKSARYSALNRKIKDSDRIKTIVLPRLATLIESAYWNGLDSSMVSEITKELAPLMSYNPSHVILACTHYSLIKPIIQKLTKAKCITPCQAVAKRVESLIATLPKRVIPITSSDDFLFKRSSLNSWELKALDSLKIQ